MIIRLFKLTENIKVLRNGAIVIVPVVMRFQTDCFETTQNVKLKKGGPIVIRIGNAFREISV